MAFIDEFLEKYYKLSSNKALQTELNTIFWAILQTASERNGANYKAFLQLANSLNDKNNLLLNDSRVTIDDNTTIKAYSDGACLGNPGAGGYGAIVVVQGRETELAGGETYTTNNRMELEGAIAALNFINNHHPGYKVVLTTDSQYVKNGITTWINGWRRNGWKTSTKEEVKNKDLWLKLDHLNSLVNPEWHWVKGHAGHLYNERCDQLATATARQQADKK